MMNVRCELKGMEMDNVVGGFRNPHTQAAAERQREEEARLKAEGFEGYKKDGVELYTKKF